MHFIWSRNGRARQQQDKGDIKTERQQEMGKGVENNAMRIDRYVKGVWAGRGRSRGRVAAGGCRLGSSQDAKD